MLEWEWYDDINVCRLWTHLLLKANHKDNRWKGVDVKAGQLVTGRHSLSDETGLTEQQIRTAIKKLKSTGEITSKIYSKFSIITITSWPAHQTDNQQENQQATNKQPASNHKQECKEGKKERVSAVNGFDYSSWPALPSEQVLKDYKSMRVQAKSKLTQTIVNRLAKPLTELHAIGYSVDEVLGICCEKSWRGLKKEWVVNAESANPQAQQQVLVR
jgi:hypothetical protein